MVTLEIVIPRKPLLTEAKQTLVLNGDNFQCYLLYRQYFSYFTECSFDISSLYVCFQNNTGKVNICSHIPYFIYSNAQMRQVKLIINRTRKMFIIWNITSRQAISTVAKSIMCYGLRSYFSR